MKFITEELKSNWQTISPPLFTDDVCGGFSCTPDQLHVVGRSRCLFFGTKSALGFWALGSGFAHPHTFSATLMSMTFRMPLYPLLLGGVQSLFGDGPWVAVFLQAIILMLGPVY